MHGPSISPPSSPFASAFGHHAQRAHARRARAIEPSRPRAPATRRCRRHEQPEQNGRPQGLAIARSLDGRSVSETDKPLGLRMLRARPSPALPAHFDDPAARHDAKAKPRPRRAGHCVVLALLVGLLVRFVFQKQLSHRRRLKRRLKPHRFFREANPYGPYNDPLVAPAWVSHEPWWRRALGRWSRAGDQRAPVFLYSCVGTAEELDAAALHRALSRPRHRPGALHSRAARRR